MTRLGGQSLGILAGHGYEGHQALYRAPGVWLTGAAIFGVADRLRQMRPDPNVLAEAHYQETGAPPTDYEPVNSLIYSPDILPPNV